MDQEPFQLDVERWVNSDPVDLVDLHGKVVVIEAFQMLCPGCVSHGIPQAKRIRQSFSADELVVLGLHTVFEHHDVMGAEALSAFLSEYRITFPVAIDRPVSGRSIPSTMGRYQLQGTPSLLILDRAGRLRHNFFGSADDLPLGARLGMLLAEPMPDAAATHDTSERVENGGTGERVENDGTRERVENDQ